MSVSNSLADSDTCISLLYQSISFPPGNLPDFALMESLFFPGATLTPPRGMAGDITRILTLNEFVALTEETVKHTSLGKRGFYENELARRSDRFGNVMQVFSSYEGFHKEDDLLPIGRGINSIQLVWEDGRWWIVSVLWDIEREDNPMPPEFLAD